MQLLILFFAASFDFSLARMILVGGLTVGH